MSIGSITEAETIFRYAQSLKVVTKQEKDNRIHADEWNHHQWLVEEFEKGWRRDPGPFVPRHAFGPVNKKPELPYGWEVKGAGISRRAYLSPSGVIYKIQHHEEQSQSNAEEHDFAQRVRRMGNVIGVIIPRTALYYIDNQPVIAMEFMDGEIQHPDWDRCGVWNGGCNCSARAGYCTDTIRRKIQHTFNIGDLHSNNVLWIPKQRKWAVVDLGM